MIKKKICLLGNEGTGKTSLANRFANDSFSQDYKSTVGVKLFTKNITFKDEEISFIIWDIRGGVEFYEQNRYYYNGAFAHIILSDSTSQESVKSISSYYNESRSNYLSSNILLCISKIDLEGISSLDSDLEALNKTCNFQSIHKTSAKLGLGIDEMFEALAQLAIES